MAELSTPRLAVNAVVINERDEVLMTLRRDAPIWCLPGGLVEIGETLSEAVAREVREEIGIDVDVIRVTGVYSAGNTRIVFPARLPTVVVAFLCRYRRGTLVTSDEVEDVRYFSLGELPAQIVETHPQRVADAMSRTDVVFD